MLYLKRFFNFFAGVGTLAYLAVPGFAAQTLSTCLDEGKALYASQNYTKSAQTFEQCLKLDAQSVDAHLSLAGVLLTQNKLDEAQKHFEAALKNMKRSSPYWSYTYSMLGDIALKQRNSKRALDMYEKSLEYNAANVNSLIGKGVVLETQGNKQEGAEAYTAALAVEPLNIIARQRLIRLEPEYLSDEEILNALKQRRAVNPDVTQLTDKQRQLFVNIHRAEQRKGVEYLKNKYGKETKDYIVTLNQGTDFARDLLTLNGYNTLEKDLGQDAVALLRRQHIPVQDVFELRDKQGKPVFTKETTLTEEGFYVYTQALAGKKEYLLPNEPVPLTQEQKQKIQVKAQNLQKNGYMEITRAELKWVETKTLCSEETLKNDLGVYFLPVSKRQNRYFVRTNDKNSLKMVPHYYVMQARKKRNPKLETPKNDIVEYYAYYGYTVCLSDGNLTLANDDANQ